MSNSFVRLIPGATLLLYWAAGQHRVPKVGDGCCKEGEAKSTTPQVVIDHLESEVSNLAQETVTQMEHSMEQVRTLH